MAYNLTTYVNTVGHTKNKLTWNGYKNIFI